jgi:hypothetical protein
MGELINNHAFATAVVVFFLVALFAVYQSFYKKKKEGFVRYIRYFLLPFTFVLGIVVYFIGYQVGNSHCECWAIVPNFLEALFSATRLFILGNDLVEIKESFKEENVLFHAMFSLTAFLAAFIFVSFLAQVFFKNWIIKRKIRFKTSTENHFFFGINQSTLSLSNDLLKGHNDRLVVFVNDICEGDNPHFYSKLSDDAFVVGRKSFLESISLEKEEGLFQLFAKKKAHNHISEDGDIFHNLDALLNQMRKAETHMYFMSDDEDWNVEYAKRASNEIANYSGEKPTIFHIATYNPISEKHITEWFKKKEKAKEGKNSTNIKESVHHYATLVSRQLIDDYHPVESVIDDSIRPGTSTAVALNDFNVLILGFGQIGTNALRKLIEQGQFVGSTFRATVIDQYVNILRGRFEHLYPGVMENYNVQFIEAEVGHVDFYSEIRKVIDRLNYIVISLGNDDLNIQTAMEILEINSVKKKKSVKILVKLDEDSHWKDTLDEFKDQIFIFGQSDKVFSEKNILQRETQAQGRTVHEVYRLLYNDTRTFDEITRHEQLSNISVAEHLYAKVRLLGYKSLEDFTAKFLNNENYKISLTDIQRLNLAIGEHLRWNAFHFIHGWTFLPFDQILGNNPGEKYGKRKNPDLKKHSCLTSWEKLKELETILKTDMQEAGLPEAEMEKANMQKADIDSIEHLYDFINFIPPVKHAE